MIALSREVLELRKRCARLEAVAEAARFASGALRNHPSPGDREDDPDVQERVALADQAHAALDDALTALDGASSTSENGPYRKTK